MSRPRPIQPARVTVTMPLLWMFVSLWFAACGEPTPNSNTRNPLVDCVRDADALRHALLAPQFAPLRLCEQTRYPGPFEILYPIELHGADGAVIEAQDGAGLRVGPASPCLLVGVAVRVVAGTEDVPVGLLLEPDATCTFRDSTIVQEAGFGVLAFANAHVTIENTDIGGNLSREALDQTDARRTPAVGVYGVEARLTLVDTSIRGVRGFAVAADGGVLQVQNSVIEENTGTGVLARGATVTGTGLRVSSQHALPILSSAAVAYGIVADGGTTLALSDIAVLDVADIGVYLRDTEASISGLYVLGTGSAGVWLDALRVPAQLRDVLVVGARGSGIRLQDANASIDGLGVLRTRTLPERQSDVAIAEVSDAISLVAPTTTSSLTLPSGALLDSFGRAGVPAWENATLLTEDDAVVACSAGTPSDARWTCQTNLNGVQQCVRRSGPETTTDWVCADSPSGTECTTSSASADTFPPTVVPAHERPVACDLPLLELLRRPGFTNLRGLATDAPTSIHAIIGEDGTLGYNLGNLLRGSHAPPRLGDWSCELTEGEQRVCRREARRELAGDAWDSPVGFSVPGWTCSHDEPGYLCVANNVAQRALDGAVLPRGAFLVPEAALGLRTTENVEFRGGYPQPRLLPTSPRSISRDALTIAALNEAGGLRLSLSVGGTGLE